MTSRPSTAAPVLVVLLLVVAAMLVAYVGGYFWLSKRQLYVVLTDGVPTRTVREFPAKWLAAAYQPLATVESWATGTSIRTDGE